MQQTNLRGEGESSLKSIEMKQRNRIESKLFYILFVVYKINYLQLFFIDITLTDIYLLF